MPKRSATAPSSAPKHQKLSTKAKKPPDSRISKNPIRIIKVGLNSILRQNSKSLNQKIITAASDLHKLTIHSYQFIASFFTHCLENNLPLPTIDDNFVADVERLVRSASQTSDPIPVKPLKSRAPPQGTAQSVIDQKNAANALRLANRQRQTAFMNEHYHSLMVISGDQAIDTTSLDQCINYIATEIITSIENNIREHYADYLLRFFKVLYRPLFEDTKVLNRHALRTRNKILHCDSDFDAADPIWQHRSKLFPLRPILHDNLCYDIKVKGKCQSYLPCMYYINSYLEQNKCKMFSLFPMRSSIIPGSFRLDTTTLLKARFQDQESIEHLTDLFDKSTTALAGSKLSDLDKAHIWNYYFKLDMHCFTSRKNNSNSPYYQFDFAIVTDGISCSIQQAIAKSDPVYRIDKDAPIVPNVYIEDAKEDLESLRTMRVVGCDPGKQDLLYFASPNGKRPDSTKKRGKLKTVDRFRYSHAQRKFETKTKWFNSLQDQEKQIQGEIDGKTVDEWQHQLSFYQRKSTKLETLKNYIREKNLVNSKLLRFWAKEIFRKLKWKAKCLKQKSEAKMMNAFKSKFGPPETTVIALGNWSQNRAMVGTEPTKGKSFRVLFKKFGYKTYMVNEYRTSKCCFNCGKELEHHFLSIPNPKLRVDTKTKQTTQCRCTGCLNPAEEKVEAKPKHEQRATIKCHGLTRCSDCVKSRGQYWNRDLNGALNIWKIARSYIEGEGRPTYLSRENSNGETEAFEKADDEDFEIEEEKNVVQQKCHKTLEKIHLMRKNV